MLDAFGTLEPGGVMNPEINYPIAERMKHAKPSFVREILKVTAQPDIISFAGGLPAPELFDTEGMKLATLETFEKQPRTSLQYSVTDGIVPVRESICAVMARRGAKLEPDDLVITNGSQQGIDLIGKIMLDPGDVVILERPSYLAAVQVFELYQADMRGVEVDRDGMIPEDLERALEEAKRDGKPAKFIYTVATFSNPTGGTLSLERRKKMLEIAVKHQVLLVEDDPYSDLRFSGTPIPPIIGLVDEVPGSKEWVASFSTLSKILAPGLRIAWMALPQALRQKVLIAKQAGDLHTSTFNQFVSHYYLESGRLQDNLPRIQDSYRLRGTTMMEELEKHIPPGVLEYNKPEGGMFLWAKMAEGVDTYKLVQKAIDEKVVFVPGQPFFPDAKRGTYLRISFSTPTPDEIKEGVQRLSRALAD